MSLVPLKISFSSCLREFFLSAITPGVLVEDLNLHLGWPSGAVVSSVENVPGFSLPSNCAEFCVELHLPMSAWVSF